MSPIAPPPTGPLLSLERVTKAYDRNGQRFTALRDVNLTIATGEFVCLLGPSGCGKSTLLRMIVGLHPVSEGRVTYRGQLLAGVNPHAAIVFQTFALYPWLTVLENVELALKARGVVRGGRRHQAVRLVHTVGLEGFEGAYPRELSGGMRQKVGFARAMAVEPELLCLDEPFSALDVLSADTLRNELLEFWLNKTLPMQAVLMVTHNIEEAVLMADRIVVMGKDPGHVVTEFVVTLRYPRNRKEAIFQALVDRVYAAVAGRTQPQEQLLGTAPGQPGPTAKLPAAHPHALAGLMQALGSSRGHANMHTLADDLSWELSRLLPLVHAAEVLGFAEVSEGDIVLTPLGQAYADAGILGRKDLISSRILRQPTIQWIYDRLRQAGKRRIARKLFLDALRPEFGDFAKQQLDTAIRWGRFAELFAFDDNTDELYLEG